MAIIACGSLLCCHRGARRAGTWPGLIGGRGFLRSGPGNCEVPGE